jgi:hypothetical protein
MILFADYEGLGVSFGLVLWFLLTVLAFILGMLGVVLGALGRRGWACWLGAAACLVEVVGVILVWLGFLEERAQLGAWAERYRPGPSFWGFSILMLALGVLALVFGWAAEDSAPPSP